MFRPPPWLEPQSQQRFPSPETNQPPRRAGTSSMANRFLRRETDEQSNRWRNTMTTTDFNRNEIEAPAEPGSIGAGAEIYRRMERRGKRRPMWMTAAPIVALAVVAAGGVVAYEAMKPNTAPKPPVQAAQSTPPAAPAQVAATPPTQLATAGSGGRGDDPRRNRRRASPTRSRPEQRAPSRHCAGGAPGARRATPMPADVGWRRHQRLRPWAATCGDSAAGVRQALAGARLRHAAPQLSPTRRAGDAKLRPPRRPWSRRPRRP